MTLDKPDLERLIARLQQTSREARSGGFVSTSDRLDEAAAALETLSARVSQAEQIATAAEACMRLEQDIASAALERAAKAEQAAEEMLANLSALVSDVLSFKQYNITSRNDYTPGLRNAIAALAGKEGNNMQAALHQEKPQGRGR
jgi:Rad3-related DNA helicase